ncbi:MAG: ATP-binding protein [Acidobacteria bacterium]|nr:ATP-binding protein [Acidobacteriota bacterium]
MIISIASGKGGTGKTTVAVNLALVVEGKVRLLDCDVEEPNSGIFLDVHECKAEENTALVPEINNDACTACAKCSEFCRYNALATLATTVLVFPELCHSCGGCGLVCPENAISEVLRRIGVIEYGKSKNLEFFQGRLDIGNTMAPPLIRSVKRKIVDDALSIIDSPPGSSCPMIAATADADYVVLVTEPTPFGLHDLKLAVETIEVLELKHGVIINRAGERDEMIEDYCKEKNIPVLAKIQDDRRIAEAYSRGRTIINSYPEYIPLFKGLLERIMEEAGGIR